MRREELTNPVGVRLTPSTHHGVGVLVLAGSRGTADESRASLFARHGAVAESVQWFGGPGQNADPFEIPVELFQERVASLAEICDLVILAGLSFGAEAALLTASLDPAVGAVIAFSPSDVVWAGVTGSGDQTSHWTVGGQPVPFVPFAEDWEPDSDPPVYRDLYLHSRDQAPQEVAAASIAVERIPTVVQVVGGDDQVWPADLHAQLIAERRARHGMATTTVTHPAAGHRAVLPGEAVATTGARMKRGGNDEANRALGETAWAHILPMLR